MAVVSVPVKESYTCAPVGMVDVDVVVVVDVELVPVEAMFSTMIGFGPTVTYPPEKVESVPPSVHWRTMLVGTLKPLRVLGFQMIWAAYPFGRVSEQDQVELESCAQPVTTA